MDPLWSARHAWKQLDEGTIAIVLNIAEGNGRYSELDHRRFLEIAETSAVKIAALLDLALRRGLLNCTVWDPVKCQLGRILARLARM